MNTNEWRWLFCDHFTRLKSHCDFLSQVFWYHLSISERKMMILTLIRYLSSTTNLQTISQNVPATCYARRPIKSELILEAMLRKKSTHNALSSHCYYYINQLSKARNNFLFHHFLYDSWRKQRSIIGQSHI